LFVVYFMFDPVAYADGQALGQELIHLQSRIDELQLRFARLASRVTESARPLRD
jgi:hypothetical protein